MRLGKNKYSWVKNHSFQLILALILVWSLAARLYKIEEPSTYYFDEVYHAFTAEAYSRNDPRGYEWWHTSDIPGTAYEWLHPPISKLFMGGSIYLLGHHSFAWRLPSALFGVLTIYAIYWLTLKLSHKPAVALLAAGFASLDGLLLTQSRIAMNDIYVVAWMIFALGFYWSWSEERQKKLFRKANIKHSRLWLSGLFTGLAIATKWSGVFVIGIVGIWELGKIIAAIYHHGLKTSLLKWTTQNCWRLILAMIVMPITIYLMSYAQFWFQGHTWSQLVELHRQIKWYQTNLDATHPYQSVPWQWVLNLKPVWMHVNYSDTGKIGNIYAHSNPMISWGGLISIIILAGVGLYQRHKQLLFIPLCYLAVWTPWIASPRIMFYYHYTPAIPFLAISLSFVCYHLYQSKNKLNQILALFILFLTIGLYGYFYPHWTGRLVSPEWANQYYWFASWQR